MSTGVNKKKETVLVVGATGNIGTAAVIGALRSGRDVLAVVRGAASADKLLRNVGSYKGRGSVTTVEADVLSEDGVQGVVDRVKRGELPAFQHVYSTAGGAYSETPLSELTTAELRQHMTQNFESNFFAYRATFPYLKSQHPTPTSFTLCVGAMGDAGMRAAPAVSQGALYSLAAAAAHETRDTGVAFVEVYLAARVETDESAAKTGAAPASEFAGHYEEILARRGEITKASRVRILGRDGFTGLRFEDKEFKL
ncbi:hypothetical protein KJ359_003319 [Pestalotiopsis sp. 9143b]|nr:hypothetical protein KJ359_003319 [Pestalotiopsis sp. 9143b]